MQKFRMPYSPTNGQPFGLFFRLFNLFVVWSLLMQMMIPVLVASAAPTLSTSPTEPQSNFKAPPTLPEHQLTMPDPTTWAMEQASAGLLDIEQLSAMGVSLEPLGSTTSARPVQPPTVVLPSTVNPLAQLQTHFPPAVVLPDPPLEKPAAEDLGILNDQISFNPTQSIWFTPPAELDVAPAGKSSSPFLPSLLNKVSHLNAKSTPSQSLFTSLYLPLLARDGEPIEPSDEVTIIPETGGILISTDGLVLVLVPPAAYPEPFVLRYTPPQEETHWYWSLSGQTEEGQTVELNRSAQLYLRLPETRTGNPLVLRYRPGNQATSVSLAGYEVGATALPVLDSRQNSQDYFQASLYTFGQFVIASLDDEDNPDEGDDGLVVPGYCWEPGEQGTEYVLSYASAISATQEAGTIGTVAFAWDVEDEEGNIFQDYGYIFDNPESIRTDYTLQPDFITLGMSELNGENSDIGMPIPLSTLLTGTVYIDELATWRYDVLEVQAYFTPGTIACTAGCEGVPPTIGGIYVTQIGQTQNPGIGVGYLEIFASDNSGEFSISVMVNGVSYEAVPTNKGTFAAQIFYNLNSWNSYEITVTDGCGNAINFPPIIVWGSDPAHHGSFACGKGACGSHWQGQTGDPVNTKAGSFFESIRDLFVPGVGNSNLVIDRDYSSAAALWTGGATVGYTDDGSGTLTEEIVAGPPQYYGPGWTFPYAVSINHLDLAPLYDGVEIHYPDGHSATFVNEGGVYVSPSPANFDTLTRTADGWTLLHKTTLEMEYFDVEGRLIRREDRNGNAVVLTYDGEYLSRVENDSGRWLAFSYTAEGLIDTITAPEGRTIRYGYTDGLLTSVTDGEGQTTTYAYDENKQLISITTPKGHTSLVQSYDDKYRVDEQTIGRAEVVDLEYSEDGLTTTVYDNDGRPTIHFYNDLGQMIKTEDALGFTEEYGYNEKFQRVYYKDKLGREWHWTYDDRGNRLTEDGPLGWHQEWAYNDLNRVVSQLTKMDNGRSRITTFTYDDKGNLTGITNALGHSSTLVYDERGLPTNVFDFEQNETVNSYHPTTGDLVETRNAAGDTIQYRYDGLGRMVEMVNGRFFAYAYSYNHNDQLTDINGPLGYHLGFRYDANGNLTMEIDPNEGETEYWYDESEMVVRIENQLNHPTVFTYDDMNHLIKLEDAEGRVWEYEYDAVYNQTAVHGPEDTHTFFTYDGVKNLTSSTACNSSWSGGSCSEKQTTTYTYNELNQLITLVENAAAGEGETADTNVTTHFKYDLVGNPLLMIDALNNPTTYAYSLLDQLVYSEDAEQQVSEYGYDKNGNLSWFKNPRGYTTTYTYDKANRLASVTDALTFVWSYFYDHNGNLSHQIDPLGVTTQFEYNALDQMSTLIQNYVKGGSSTYDQNVTTRFEYDLAGNLRFAYDPRGRYTTEHRYDSAHRRVLTIDNEGGETEYGYDKVNNLTRLIDGNNHETIFTYDGLNRRVQITNPEGHFVKFTYDRLGNVLVVTDGRGYDTTFTYDGMNRVVLKVDALKGEWQYSYDAMGNLLCQIDANGHANDCYTYDKVYRPLTVTDAENYVDSFTYDENGNRLTWTDGNGHTSNYSYNALDRLWSYTNAELETTTYLYDPLGNQTYLVEADNITTRYDYDPLYRLVTVNENDRPGEPESADVNVDTHYIYDQVGNLLTIIDAEQHETQFVYDGMNRQTQETDADFNVWQYGYDFVGNRTWRIDANGNRTDYTYYPDNQLKTIHYELDNTQVSYTYDRNNNPTQMVDHLGTTTWVYDELNRITDVTDAFGRHLGYGYDAVSNRTSLTYHDGRVVQYTYYDNNWLKTAVDPENNVTSYKRDGVGLMVGTTNPNETVTTAAYDKANRLLTLVNEQISGARKINSAFTYTYNEVGHRTQMVAEFGWRNPSVVTSTYTYDGLRRLVRDEDSEGVWTEYTFDRVGNRLVLNTNDDSLSPRPFDEKTIYYSFSPANRLLSLVGNTHPGSPGVKREENVGQAIYAFRHEVLAQQGVHISKAAGDNLLFMADQLISALEGHPVPSVYEVTQMVEAIRQQVQADWAGGLITNAGTANSLLAKLQFGDSANNNGANDEWQTQTFTYDPNGNRINTEYPGPQGPRVQGTDYTYDPENRLIVAWDYQENLQGNRVDRAISTLEYDGGGRRLSKTYDPNEGGGGAKRVEYLFDGWDPVAEYQMWNPQYENFYRGDLNRIITMHHFPSGTAGQMYWYHYDGLGSVSGLTKQIGQSHHNYRYEPYGQIEMPPGNFTDPHNHYTFTGQEWDENMGVYEFYARKYDPNTGVWLSQDTYRGEASTPASLHRYQYVYGNPISYYDPTGHWPEFINNATEWVKDNQDVIAKVAITGLAVVATGAVCTATMGACIVGAGVVAATASYSTQVVDNVWEASGESSLFDAENYNTDTMIKNIDWEQVIVDGVIGATTAGIGAGSGNLSSSLLTQCKGPNAGLCRYAITTASGVVTGSISQMSSNLLDGDPCTNLWDGVLSSGVYGGVLSTVAYGSITGDEIKIGNTKIAPFGNRTSNSVGRYPHYHRRISDPQTGQTIPGGSPSRHRPWE